MQSSYKQIPKIEATLKGLKIDFKLKSFFEDIHIILASSDIVIARSGAGTINDIIESQIPSILVPLPHAIYDHQYLNAKYLVDKSTNTGINNYTNPTRPRNYILGLRYK